MMEHKIMLLVRVNVFNSTHPTKRNFSIIICFMLFAEWLRRMVSIQRITIFIPPLVARMFFPLFLPPLGVLSSIAFGN